MSLFTYSDNVAEIWHVADTGMNNANQQAVADLLTEYQAPVILCSGDVDYLNPHNYAATVGAYYEYWTTREMFFPCPGNHDWDIDGLNAYTDYFDYLDNRRYYDVRIGPVHAFMMDSGYNTAGTLKEPDGNAINSAQYDWFAAKVAGSDAPWKLVCVHTPPHTSGLNHGPTTAWRWDFAAKGVNAVLCGHNHQYERIVLDDVAYVVNGMGGSAMYGFTTPVTGSVVRYNGALGALKIRATTSDLTLAFINIQKATIDTYTVQK